MADVPAGAAGAKPPSRGLRTPAKISAASTVSFALGKKLQTAYDAVDVGKTKLIEFAQLTAFLDKAGIKYYDLEIAKIGRQLAFEAEHMERDNGTKLTFDDVLSLLSKPNYTLCLYIEELMTKERRDMMKKYLTVILGEDEAARKAALAQPPTQLLGDKQAVRKFAIELHEQERHPELVRVNLARGLAAIAEKPREVSGVPAPEGEKRNMMYDSKAIAACLLPLMLGEEYFLDKRSFYNPEPRSGAADPSADPPVGVGLTQALMDWRSRGKEVRRELTFHDTVPTDYCSRPEYYVPFKRVLYEHSEPVRIECVKTLTVLGTHETEVIVKALLHSTAHDPSWAVRAAAVEKLGDIARELRKLGYKSRWGELKFWFLEDEEPWRDSPEDYRAFFWSVLEGATRDLAWQVRKRAVQTISDAVVFGDQVPYNWITACAEDASEIVKNAATKVLMNALFGRGSVISERNYKLQQLLQDGLSPEEAVSAADEHAVATKEEDWERAVVGALVHRSHHPSAMTRRQALQTLATVLANTRLKGDNQGILAMLEALEDDDVLVRTAAVRSLRMTALNSDTRVVKGLVDTALYDSEWQTRKAAVEGLEAIAIQGDKQVVDAFQELTRDKDSWIREAAVKALETIAIEDDELSKSTVTRNLQDSSWEVRRAAARTLMLLEPEGDKQDTVGPKVFGKPDKEWWKQNEGYMRKPLFMPLR